MRYGLFGLLLLILTGCLAVSGEPQDDPTGTPGELKSSLDDLGPAPELTNDVWLNTDQSLRLADLRGKVVLLDMWTFG